jgi:gas vesicle protein
MRYFLAILGGAAVGAGAALLFAPQTGRATRSMIRDKTTKYANDVSEFVDGKSQHLKNKLQGLRHSADEMMKRGQEMVDEVGGSLVGSEQQPAETTTI